jgi:hypothetical protein
MIYYLIFGYINIYGENNILSDTVKKSFFINTFSLLMSALIVMMIFKKELHKIKPKYEKVNELFYVTILFLLFSFFAFGGFQVLLSGSINGRLINYINQMINPLVIFAMVLFYQEKKFNFILVSISFVVFQTLTGSRSAALQLLIIILIFYPGFENQKKYLHKAKIFTIVIVILSPLLFIAGTVMREVEFDFENIQKIIIGRLSFLELSEIPMECKTNGGQNCNIDIFYDKYNFFRQIKLSVDMLYPGNLFIDDVHPNQYYRSAFLGLDESYALENYMSINMSIPTYFYMHTNEIFSIILSITSIVIYVYLLLKSINKIYFFLPLLICLYQFLNGFDFVYLTRQLSTCFITVLFVIFFIKLKKIINGGFKFEAKRA